MLDVPVELIYNSSKQTGCSLADLTNAMDDRDE